MRCFLNILLPVTALAASVAALAQAPSFSNVGRTPNAEEIRAWDIAIGPSGKELPPGSGTAKDGAKIYAQKCAACHGPTGAEGQAPEEGRRTAPPLVGAKDLLSSDRPQRTVGNYWAFATTLWDFINRTMPWGQEGSLKPDEVYATTAFVLFRNGIIQENDVMDAKSLPKVPMPNRNGYVPPRPDWKLFQDCSRLGLNCPTSLIVK